MVKIQLNLRFKQARCLPRGAEERVLRSLCPPRGAGGAAAPDAVCKPGRDAPARKIKRCGRFACRGREKRALRSVCLLRSAEEMVKIQLNLRSK